MSSSSIYRSSLAKKPKPTNQSQEEGGGGVSAGGDGWGGSRGAGAGWTVVGGVAGVGKTYPCSGKHCGGAVNIRNRRNSALLFGVCDTCGVYFYYNKKCWGTSDNPRGCDWCGEDNADSPSIGVKNDGPDKASKRESDFLRITSAAFVFVWRPRRCFLSRCLIPAVGHQASLAGMPGW